MNRPQLVKPDKRRVLLINPKFQLAFGLYTALVGLGVAGLFYAVIRFFFWNFENLGRASGFPPDHVFFEFIGEQVFMMNVIFVVAAPIICLLIIGFGIYLSHKVAGPLYRLRSHMEEVAATGKLKQMFFRKGDFFPELAEAYNKQNKALEKDEAKAC